MKIKSMCGVKFNINYIPQDWRYDFKVEKNGKKVKIDARVSLMPALRGESIVIRFLDWSERISSFTEIGFMWQILEKLNNNIFKTSGIVLLTGPTWSWKSTTLYSILDKLNKPDKKIITLEEPVEYELPGLQQSQMMPDKWYTYVEWLRAVLRQDPDIIMVWEIRSLEEAEIAINAALTWHLVFATLHTSSAIGAIWRLLHMWVKPFMLASAISLIVWQRLVRRLCECKKYRPVSVSESAEIDYILRPIRDVDSTLDVEYTWSLNYPDGCAICTDDWYKWRIVAAEALEITDTFKDMLVKNSSALELFEEARRQWFLTMKDDAVIKMLKWYTSLEEIRRVLG